MEQDRIDEGEVWWYFKSIQIIKLISLPLVSDLIVADVGSDCQSPEW